MVQAMGGRCRPAGQIAPLADRYLFICWFITPPPNKSRAPMTTRRIMSIHDDCAGDGVDLAFPTMSSCAACICVLDDRLVGVHKTQGWVPFHDKLFNYAKRLIGTAKVHGLYVAGWNADTTRHDLSQIANALGLTGSRQVRMWSANYTNTTKAAPSGKLNDAHRPGPLKNKMTDLCTFAFMNGTQAPKVGIKRESKVTVHAIMARDAERKIDAQKLGMSDRESQMLSYEEMIDTPSSHLHFVTFQSAT